MHPEAGLGACNLSCFRISRFVFKSPIMCFSKVVWAFCFCWREVFFAPTWYLRLVSKELTSPRSRSKVAGSLCKLHRRWSQPYFMHHASLCFGVTRSKNTCAHFGFDFHCVCVSLFDLIETHDLRVFELELSSALCSKRVEMCCKCRAAL